VRIHEREPNDPGLGEFHGHGRPAGAQADDDHALFTKSMHVEDTLQPAPPLAVHPAPLLTASTMNRDGDQTALGSTRRPSSSRMVGGWKGYPAAVITVTGAEPSRWSCITSPGDSPF